MRRLVIDCQILQTPAYDRGMGKYTLSLLEAFLATNNKKPYYGKVQLVLSKNLEISSERINAIKKRLIGAEVILLDLPTDISTDLPKKQQKAESVLTAYIEKGDASNTDFLITAPFFVGFAAAFPKNDGLRKFSIVYDLIPQKIWQQLRIFPDDIYFNHYLLLLAADHLFTISHAVKDDLIQLLGMSKDKLTSIDGGPFMRAATIHKKLDWQPETKSYVLMPSAPIVHKNNERAVQAFNQFNKKNDNAYTLYITSNFDEAARDKLRALSSHVEFTGNISDEALGQAYSSASAVLFPSLSEGLGMPVLEAALYGVPVACSNIPVLSELSDTAFYQFDPISVPAIADKLSEAVNKADWPKHVEAYKQLKKKYTWERSAALLLGGVSGYRASKNSVKKPLQLVLPKPNHSSPAGFLGEQLYAGLSRTYQLGLSFSATGTVNTPSYVAYVPQSAVEAPELTLRNKRRLLVKKRGRLLELQLGTRRLKLYANRIFLDKALQLEGWRFSDQNGKRVSTNELISWIFKGVS